MARTRIGEMLVRQRRIDAVQLESALAFQRQWGGRLGRAIVHLGFMTERAVLESIGEQLGVPFVEIAHRQVPEQVLALVPKKLIRARRVLPLAHLAEGRRGTLVVALADPADLGVLDEIAFATGLKVKPVLAAEGDLDRAIAQRLEGAARPLGAIDVPEDTSPLAAARKPGALLN